MLTVLKRHEIQVLNKAGHKQAEIARLAGVSERSVRRVIQEDAVATVDDAAERSKRNIGRPAKAERFRDFVIGELKKEPEVMSLEVLRRARLNGYDGGKTALYSLIAAVRPQPQRPIVRFEGLPGEFSQHDFGHVDVQFLDGTKKRIHFFASRLKYSRWVEVSIVPDERVESLVRPLVEHFEKMGGIPLLAVFDRPKTVAITWRKNGEVTEWNQTFGSVMLELGLGVEVCWPRSPQQKGSVENLVGWVKGSFFKQRRFLDEEDLFKQLAEWHTDVNTQRPSRATNEIPGKRMVEEKARLRPLKVAPNALSLRFPVFVGPTGMVLHDTRRYSMPPDAIGMAGTLYLYRDKVRIVAGRFSAEHDRLVDKNAVSTLPEHRAQMVAAVSGKRGQRYLKRQHLLELGPPALDYLTELTHRQPREWIRHVDRLHELLQQYGPSLLRSAFEHALREQTFGAEYVAHFVEKEHVALLMTPIRTDEVPQ
jgi:transposase